MAQGKPELSPEQIAKLKEARKRIPELRSAIQKAKAAGIDMTAQEAELKRLEKLAQGLHDTYVLGKTTTGD